MTDSRYVVPYLPTGSTFGDEEINAVARVLRSGDTLSCGPERDAFEAEFAEYVGVPHAISLTARSLWSSLPICFTCSRVTRSSRRPRRIRRT